MRLTDLPRPFIVAVITDRTPQEAIATMRLAQYDGAHAYELNLPALPELSPDALRQVFAATDQPVYVTCRRAEFMTVYGIPCAELSDWDDEARMDRQLQTLAFGAAAIDVEMDAFDPRPAPPLGSAEAETFAHSPGSPAEVTDDWRALAQQQEVIAAAHAAGGQVILSCHTGRPLSLDGLVGLAELACERAADLVKIVSPCATLADLFAMLEATARLRARLRIPFTVVGAGEMGQLSRSIGVHFGASWAIGQQTLAPGGFHPQPLVAHLRETLRLLPWRYQLETPCA